MTKTALYSPALFALSLILASCGAGATSGAPLGQTPPPGTTAPGGPTGSAPAGYLMGKVTDARGHPIKGAKINADNTAAYDSNLVAYSGADGTYKLDLGVYPVTWNVTGHVNLKYNGQDVPVTLKSSNTEVVPGGPQGGGVRNFTYDPQVTADNPHGDLGRINVSNAFGLFGVDFAEVTLSITPVGPLADGSTGAPLTVKPVKTADGWIVANVMYGTYTVSATMKGEPLAVRPVLGDGTESAWGDSYTGGFTWPYWATRPTMFLELGNGH